MAYRKIAHLVSLRHTRACAIMVCSVAILFATHGLAQSQTGHDAPVFYNADEVQYDREAGIVTATGHVEAWQEDKTLTADKIVFDRTTGVAAATGHVVLQEADGQVTFSDYAELSQDMKDGVLNGMRSQLMRNGKLAAVSARRTDARINELSRMVYTTCDLCASDPTKAPLWDIRARQAIQDIDNKRIEYTDAIVEIYGIPVMYTPYLTHPDPTQKRASGILPASWGTTKKLGTYFILPYYYVINDSSDVILSPELTTKGTAIMGFNYRQRLNSGTVKILGSFGEEWATKANGKQTYLNSGHIFANGAFAIDDIWRWGFSFNRASSAKYLQDIHLTSSLNSLLSSNIYLEGFGEQSYTRADMTAFQSLTTNSTNNVPFVLPRTQYAYAGDLDGWGGRTTVQTGAFNVVRPKGTTDQRANLSAGWSRPFTGPIGDLWKISADADTAAYNAHGLSKTPNYATIASASAAQAMPTVSLEASLPMVRSESDGLGTQTIEPITKLMVSPRGSSYRKGRIPNEDSLLTDFTDANLFARNRNAGVDRLEGGVRLAVGLKGNWTLPAGAQFSGMVGQSYRTQTDPYFSVQSGLRGTDSDFVARQSFTPSPFLDLTTRERFNHDTLRTELADATISGGPSFLRMNAGYLYSTTTPYAYYDAPPTAASMLAVYNRPRHEASVGFSSQFSPWKISTNVRRDLRTNQMVSIDADGSYENECFIFDLRYYRRYTSVLTDTGDTGLLINITLKTVGDIGFNAE